MANSEKCTCLDYLGCSSCDDCTFDPDFSDSNVTNQENANNKKRDNRDKTSKADIFYDKIMVNKPDGNIEIMDTDDGYCDGLDACDDNGFCD